MCVQWVQVVLLEDGDEVIEVMLIPNKPAKEELVVLVTAAGFMTKQPLERLMEQTWEADDIKPFKCMTVRVSTATVSSSSCTIISRCAWVD